MYKKINISILEIFFQSPEQEFNVREVARLRNVSPATASKELHLLEKEKILKKREERYYLLFQSNLESDSYKDIKVYYMIRALRESGLINKLNDFYLKPTIVLYGSAAYGLDTSTSDVDLIVISEKTEAITNLRVYEHKINRAIHLMNIKELKELKNEHLINNVLNGILVQGSIQWI
ncbi:TPA: nucleotidyltransferase domain-containing protein [Candidatus Woesearchaeota archaeon]|nr:nucleotidyltransferase domain-containing protein [Candidatus Woesearchaeota archaeon]